MRVVYCLIFLSVFVHSLHFSDRKLKKLSVIYRHGDRAPEFTPFPTDPNINYVWTDGKGNLTKIGRDQAFDLGKYIRSEYINFLTFNPNEVYARSSPYLRCIKTTGCVLNGIYSPSNPANCYNETGFTASPVYTINPKEYDHMLYYVGTCPKYSALLYKIFTSSAHAQTAAFYKDTVSRLRELTGLQNLTFNDIVGVYDDLIVEAAHKLPTPDWVPELLPGMKQIVISIYNELTQYPDVARLLTGSLLNDLISRMTEEDNCKKLYLYGTHDIMLISIMKLLHIYNEDLPPYASAIIIEVRRKGLGILSRDYVEIYYRNSSSVAPYRLDIKGCSGSCSVRDLIRLTEGLAVDNPEEACKISLN